MALALCSGCLGKHGSGSSASMALTLLLLFGHGSSGEHGSGSSGTALRASMALVLRGARLTVLALLSNEQLAFLKAPNLQNTLPRLYLLNTT